MNHESSAFGWFLKKAISPTRTARVHLFWGGRFRWTIRGMSFLGLVMIQLLGTPAFGAVWSQWFGGNVQHTPHPSVVRISVQEKDGVSLGSGTLVDVREQHGLVVTNWHVVRDATGSIQVSFPDGFRSAARVLSVDRDWDLAALSIWRPNAKPVPLAARAPLLGDTLTIAGYGPGNYRSVTGRCTQYVAPSDRHPFEMVELSARARQGDSGGPIFNTQGELAGVLFGSDGSTTSGSFSGRVQSFLATAWPPPGPADSSPDSLPQFVAKPALPLIPTSEVRESDDSGAHDYRADSPPYQPLVPLPTPNLGPRVAKVGPPLPASAPVRVQPQRSASDSVSWQDLAGDTMAEQIKSVLATIGACAVLLQLGRFLTTKK